MVKSGRELSQFNAHDWSKQTNTMSILSLYSNKWVKNEETSVEQNKQIQTKKWERENTKTTKTAIKERKESWGRIQNLEKSNPLKKSQKCVFKGKGRTQNGKNRKSEFPPGSWESRFFRFWKISLSLTWRLKDRYEKIDFLMSWGHTGLRGCSSGHYERKWQQITFDA